MTSAAQVIPLRTRADRLADEVVELADLIQTRKELILELRGEHATAADPVEQMDLLEEIEFHEELLTGELIAVARAARQMQIARWGSVGREAEQIALAAEIVGIHIGQNGFMRPAEGQ